MKKILKEQAIQLRFEGWTYSAIAKRTGVSKGTLSHWLRNLPFAPNAEALSAMKAGPAKSSLVRHAARTASIEEARRVSKEEICSISERDLFMLGIGLYMGEGKKSQEYVGFANANPLIIRLMLRWLTDACQLEIKNLKATVHSYPESDLATLTEFWSATTGIPREHFCKPQIDRRSGKSELKRGKTPYGTLHIGVKSCGNPQFGVFLHRRIMGWIDAAFNLAGIV